MEEKEIKQVVKERYARLAKWDQQKCCPSCGCGGGSLSQVEAIGYSREDVEHIPEEAVMNLGCGNPTAIASPEAGEIVLDLGAGAGADVFLAANRVGGTGRVIGVDMTKEMVDRARIIAKSHDYHNVEFRLGEIEKLPVESESVDVVISNCVINLSPDKSKVFQEAHRVLKPGGRLVVSDKVSERTLPDETKNDLDAWAGCIAGTLERQEYLNKIEEAGFKDVQVISSREFYVQGRESKAMVKLMSITVKAYKAARHNIAQNN
jgi:ubiquinone/menaquinone biosynthesis C-methylase UbiE